MLWISVGNSVAFLMMSSALMLWSVWTPPCWKELTFRLVWPLNFWIADEKLADALKRPNSPPSRAAEMLDKSSCDWLVNSRTA